MLGASLVWRVGAFECFPSTGCNLLKLFAHRDLERAKSEAPVYAF